jgi:hypothetical protein
MNQDKSRVKEGKRLFKTKSRLKTSLKGLAPTLVPHTKNPQGTIQEIARDYSIFLSPHYLRIIRDAFYHDIFMNYTYFFTCNAISLSTVLQG